jgi:hypothetical protein
MIPITEYDEQREELTGVILSLEEFANQADLFKIAIPYYDKLFIVNIASAFDSIMTNDMTMLDAVTGNKKLEYILALMGELTTIIDILEEKKDTIEVEFDKFIATSSEKAEKELLEEKQTLTGKSPSWSSITLSQLLIKNRVIKNNTEEYEKYRTQINTFTRNIKTLERLQNVLKLKSYTLDSTLNRHNKHN